MNDLPLFGGLLKFFENLNFTNLSYLQIQVSRKPTSYTVAGIHSDDTENVDPGMII